VGGVYGNGNFSYMLDYMLYEAGQGRRAVMFYPETSYWVNVDADVPLFLPVYAERRLHDLRLLAREEQSRGLRLAGVLNFDSAWEWGYWLNNVVMAAAMWDPSRWDAAPEGPFAGALMEVLKPLERGVRARLADWLVRLTRFQVEVLLRGARDFGVVVGWRWRLIVSLAGGGCGLSVRAGDVKGKKCFDPTKLTGIAFLMGQDTWVEIPRALGLFLTQPDKVQPSAAKHSHALSHNPGRPSKVHDALTTNRRCGCAHSTIRATRTWSRC
jgi:hypothetical protein